MSVDSTGTAQLAPYDDDEDEIQLMDADSSTLQLDEQFTHTNTNVLEKTNKEKPIEEEQETKISPVLIIEKLKVYIRDGPNSHHVETILVDDKYYELPTTDELTMLELTEDKFKEILESLNLTKEDFRTSESPTGISRAESLFVCGVNNMSTQEILNYFEEFKPIGIEWISDQSCNVFWHDALTPIKLLSIKTIFSPDVSHPHRVSKRKASSMLTDHEKSSIDVDLPAGYWREGDFQSIDKPQSSIKLYLRYTTLYDRKVRGAENQSKYYQQYGNPNYNNMTGLISRSKKRALNAMKSNRFQDFTVVKSNDPTSTSSSIIDETTTTAEDNTTDGKVKFTVVLPPKKGSADNEAEDDAEGDHRTKRQRGRRSWDEEDDDRRRKEKTQFTVTIDSPTKYAKDSRNKSNEKSESSKDDDNDQSTSFTDARQILERKRRNRK